MISPLVYDPVTAQEVYVRSETIYDERGRRVQSIENLLQLTPDENAK